jgi:hypothetical protein
MELTAYHYAFTRADLHPVQFDEQGIPYVHLPGVRRMCHPITVANWGLHYYNRYIETKESPYRDRAIRLADWLVAAQCDDVWFIDMASPYYGIGRRWISALVQGQAIGFLARMAALLGQNQYLACARRALEPFGRTVGQGGVLARTEWGDFYEEYPSNPPSLVLNGFVFTLFGLHDLGRLHGVARARSLYENGLSCLKRIVSCYDTGYWTRYDLFPIFRLASQEYHRLHIALLKSASRLSRTPGLGRTAQSWQGYANSMLCQGRWLFGKLQEKTALHKTRASLWLRLR